MQIRNYQPADREAVVRLSLRAWEPVFAAMPEVLDQSVYDYFYPDWRQCQQQAVEEVCADEKNHVWVAEHEGSIVGFTAVAFRSPTFGEIYMLAVDPAHQRRGYAQSLTAHALDWMRSQGVSVAMVETGGDSGHAPARACYERSGFRLFPVARYFMKL